MLSRSEPSLEDASSLSLSFPPSLPSYPSLSLHLRFFLVLSPVLDPSLFYRPIRSTPPLPPPRLSSSSSSLLSPLSSVLLLLPFSCSCSSSSSPSSNFTDLTAGFPLRDWSELDVDHLLQPSVASASQDDDDGGDHLRQSLHEHVRIGLSGGDGAARRVDELLSGSTAHLSQVR